MNKISRSSIWKLLMAKEAPRTVVNNGESQGGVMLEKADAQNGTVRDSVVKRSVSVGDVLDHDGKRAVVVSAPRIMPGDPSAIGKEVKLKLGVPSLASLITGSLSEVVLEGECSGFDESNRPIVKIG